LNISIDYQDATPDIIVEEALVLGSVYRQETPINQLILKVAPNYNSSYPVFTDMAAGEGYLKGSLTKIKVTQDPLIVKKEIWTITAQDETTFSVVGSESGVQADATVDVVYSNPMVSFLITSGYDVFWGGDEFTFEIAAEGPTYSITGIVPTPTDLLALTPNLGDLYITTNVGEVWTNHAWVSNGLDWEDMGPYYSILPRAPTPGWVGPGDDPGLDSQGNETPLVPDVTYFIAADSVNPVVQGTGNGFMKVISVNQTTEPQTWTITATNATTFTVVGSVSGAQTDATVGSVYDNGKISFKITDNTTPFIAGDVFVLKTAMDISRINILFNTARTFDVWIVPNV
jgi:hypothetical protein